MYMFIIIIFVSVCDRFGSSSDLLKSWGGGVWRSHAEYVWRVVYYWVQCCIVRVTCGAHSVHSAASTCVYKEREHLVCIRAVRPHSGVCIV